MRTIDILSLALTALWQQKGRTFLTMSGVVIGTFALTVIISLGEGFQAAVARQFRKGNQLRQVMVNPGFGTVDADKSRDEVMVPGEMDETKRRRLRKTLLSRRGMGNPQQQKTVRLDEDRMAALAGIEHVEAVTPMISDAYRVSAEGRPAFDDVVSFGAEAGNERFQARVIAGRWLAEGAAREIVVHEYLLYRWGLIADGEVESMLGKTVTLQRRGAGKPGGSGGIGALLAGGANFLGLTEEETKTLKGLAPRIGFKVMEAVNDPKLSDDEKKLIAKLQKKIAAAMPKPGGPDGAAEEFTVVGVVREFMEDDDINFFEAGMSLHADLFLPMETARGMYLASPANRENGFPSAIVTADSEEHAGEVARRIRGMGLTGVSMGSVAERVRTALSIVTLLVAFLAAVALLVAALGIINTMIMSVLERTREIGIMKALGARDGHVQLLFFVESSLIGVFGGILGVTAGWLITIPGDMIGRWWIEKETLTPVKDSLFVFPPWLPAGAVAFAAVVAVLAAVYPARRAAKVDPIKALRRE
jgi:putative ABC transport system permease protein